MNHSKKMNIFLEWTSFFVRELAVSRRGWYPLQTGSCGRGRARLVEGTSWISIFVILKFWEILKKSIIF